MKKVLKGIGIGIIVLPVLAIALFIGYEIVGAVVNSLATSKQTSDIQGNIQDNLKNVSIIDTYSETGNTSGTGNHVDMLSVVVFRIDEDLDTKDITDKMSAEYSFNEMDCWISDLNSIIAYHEKDRYYFDFLDKMKLPDDREKCFIFVRYESAPFSDNIVGH